MKRSILCLIFLLLARIAAAAAIDAPHRDIPCATCHSYSLWWQYSPTTHSPAPADLFALVDTVCMTCHQGAANLPAASTHSSSVMNSLLHGRWQIRCTTCHNPHFQEQLDWLGSPAELYLVTGLITGVSFDPSLGQSTLFYQAATANPDWPAEDNLATAPDWSNKSQGNPGRGLILVHDTLQAANTFSVIAATAAQVVVKGEIAPSAIDPGYRNPLSGQANSSSANTFGLIYGQLLRSAIAGRAVKFFNPRGGFVEGEENPTGICQVCHTETSHFANSGIIPAPGDSHDGRLTSNCVACHKHNGGFKGNGHDDSSFAWAGNCATCHDPSGAMPNIVNVVHGGHCELCHENSAGGGPRKNGDPAHGIDGRADFSGASNQATCSDCHLTAANLSGAQIHHDSAHGYAAAGNCAPCHGEAAGLPVAAHNTFVSSAPECTWCHTAAAGLASGMPVSAGDHKVHAACTSCHQTDGALKAATGRAIAMPAQGGSCTDCHGDYFLNHQEVERYHNTFLAKSGTSCESCHNQSGNLATQVVGVIHKIGEDKLAPGGVREGEVVCELCHHRLTGSLVNGKTRGANKSGVYYMTGDARKHTLGTASSCNVCHSYTFPGGGGMSFTSTHASYGDHYNNLRNEESCRRCHNALLAPYDGSDEFGHPEVHKLSCSPCHGGVGWSLAGSALNHTVFSPSSCSTCHPHPNAAQTYHGFSKASGGLAGGYIKGPFTFKSVFAGAAADLASCQSSVDNGATWTAGYFLDFTEGLSPSFICAQDYPALANGPVTLRMRATTKQGGVMDSDAVAATVESGPSDGAALTVTPGMGQNALSWEAASDATLGLRASNTYEVRWRSGEIPANHPFACTVRTVEDPAGGYLETTAGTLVYTGTATSFVHDTGLPLNLKANYRVCAYNSKDYVSPGLQGAATITSGPSQFYVKGIFSSSGPPPLTSLTFASRNDTFLEASAISYRPANAIGPGPQTLVTVQSEVLNGTMAQTIAALSAKFSLRSSNAADRWTFNVYAYHPATGDKILVATSGEILASLVQKDWYPAMTIANGGTVPAGNKLMLEVIYNATAGEARPTFYYNHQGQASESRISVTFAP